MGKKYTIVKSASDIEDEEDYKVDELLRSNSYMLDFSKRWNEATRRIKRYSIKLRKKKGDIFRCSSGIMYYERKENSDGRES